MVRDFKYIIKKIIVGVGIALVLSFLKGNLLLSVHAKEISSVWMPFSSHVVVVDNLDNTLQFTPSNNGHWANWGYGILRFNFSIIKVSGDSTSPLVIPNNVNVNNYVCDVSSTSVGNSTFTGATYSAVCPMIMGSTGLGNMYILLTDNQQNSLSNYRVTVGGLVTFEKVDDVTLDTSSTTSAINNQITNDNSNTQSIINNNNSNTQSIINNQNSNTQQQIESQKSCRNYSSKDCVQDGYLNTDGSIGSSSNGGITDYINITNIISLNLVRKSNANSVMCFYSDNKSLISCYRQQQLSLGVVSVPDNASFVRFSILYNSDLPLWSVCKNGNQAIVDSQQDINNSLNDTSGGEVSSSWFDDFRDNSNSPVSDLLTMPITLLQAYLTGFSGNCQSMNLGSLYGSYIVIPCINIEDYLGSDLWSLIDVLFTLFMLYNIGMLCVTIYEGITSLNDDMQFLYSPRHAGAGDSRVERYGDNY